jgi:exopolysaccharide biosynthesis protein
VPNLLPILLIAIVARRASGTWTFGSRESTSKAGVVCTQMEVKSDDDQGKIWLVRFDPGQRRLAVIASDGNAAPNAETIVRQTGALAAVNGGYFQSNFEPVGLLIADSQLIHPAAKARLLTGTLYVRDNHPFIARSGTQTKLAGITAAIQCGPLLIENRRAVSGLNDEKVAPRTFVLQFANGKWGFGVCRSVTLAQMAEILAATGFQPDTAVEKALNLDGGSSTQFYFAADSPVASPTWATVANFLVLH